MSSQKRVLIIDLAKAKEKPRESVNEFVIEWRNINLQCSEKLYEQTAIQLCSNNLLSKIATSVSTVRP